MLSTKHLPVPATCKALCWGHRTTDSLDRALQREQELSRKLERKASAASTGTREAGESGGSKSGRPLLEAENVPEKGESALVGMGQGGFPKLPREGGLASITGYTTPCLGFAH